MKPCDSSTVKLWPRSWTVPYRSHLRLSAVRQGDLPSERFANGSRGTEPICYNYRNYRPERFLGASYGLLALVHETKYHGPMESYNINQAKAHLSKLIEKSLAGNDIAIARAGKPLVRLIPYVEGGSERKGGALRGLIHIRDDFDAPLPEDIAKAFANR